MIFIGRTIVFPAAASREIHFLEIIADERSLGVSSPLSSRDNPSASERRAGKKGKRCEEKNEPRERKGSLRDPLLWEL